MLTLIYYLPTQNLLKIRSKISSLLTIPITSSSASRASLRSTATHSGGRLSMRLAMAEPKASSPRSNAFLCLMLVSTVGGSVSVPRSNSLRAVSRSLRPYPCVADIERTCFVAVVSRRPREGRNDHAVVSKQSVQQARLADIRSSTYTYPCAVAEEPPTLISI